MVQLDSNFPLQIQAVPMYTLYLISLSPWKWLCRYGSCPKVDLQQDALESDQQLPPVLIDHPLVRHNQCDGQQLAEWGIQSECQTIVQINTPMALPAITWRESMDHMAKIPGYKMSIGMTTSHPIWCMALQLCNCIYTPMDIRTLPNKRHHMRSSWQHDTAPQVTASLVWQNDKGRSDRN